jgi:[ribosomal protein S18]-alanine N-acetyltransferase
MTEPIENAYAPLLGASGEHAAELARLHAGLFAKPWDEASFRRFLSHPGSAAFLARVGTPPQSAGLILGRLAADEAEILTLGVRREHQRHGLARLLVHALARAAKKAGAKWLFLEVAQSNAAAAALYVGLGFRQVGLRKGYYEHAAPGGQDALVLRRAL